MELFLAYFDQFRYMAGSLAICMILCREALPHRVPYRARVAGGAAVCLTLAFAYVPLMRVLQPAFQNTPLVIAPYWLLMSFVLVWFVRFTHETSLVGALFRTMMAAFGENIVTVLIKNLFVYTFFPDFPETHPFIYITGMIAVYALFCWSYRRSLGRRIQSDAISRFATGREAAWIFLLIYLSYTALLSTSKFVMEQLIHPVSAHTDLQGVYRYLQFYLVGVMLLLSVMMTVIMWYLYQRVSLQAEKDVIVRLARDRQSQYEFSRENIEMINRKTHDLKHQLQALSMVDDEERKRQIQETSRTIDFYDAVVKTGNEALDVLLTEKSVYCANRGIRLSCMVNTERLSRIRLVDLYTLLGNALDNAIESVERISDPERKIISLSIKDQGGMLYIQVSNYFDGVLDFSDGLPHTRKLDTDNHGYGLKSIRSIAHSYGGQMDVHAEDQVFHLEIMIP